MLLGLIRTLCLTVAIAAGFTMQSASAQDLHGCEQHVKYGAPSQAPVLLCRLGYALSFDTGHRVPDWVAYHLTRQKMSGTHPRSNDFRPDPDLDTGQRSELSDYAGSGFDRGHMAPAASMKWDARAMSESFLLSNMAPQVGAGFNNGIWRTLESRVRTWTRDRGELYIVSGPIFATDPPPHVPSGNVSIPSHFYKVIFDPVRVEAIAFILANQRTPSAQLPTFIVNVDTVEQQTGLDFLSRLQNGVESLVEAQVAPAMW